MDRRKALICSLPADSGHTRDETTISELARMLTELGFEQVSIRLQRDWVSAPSSAPQLVVLVVTPDWLPRLEAEIQSFRQSFAGVPVLAALVSIECHRNRLPLGCCDDFIVAPVHFAELATRVARLTEPNAPVVKSRHRWGPLIGESPAFEQTMGQVDRLAAVDSPVLIHGETGSGKELFSRAIHYSGARAAKPFIPVNCGAVPESLFENELFGHAKGAFTNADTSVTGLLSAAADGTVFLDEVDTLSLSSQVKLLRFLEEFEYRPLGSARSVAANVRVLAATNADLRERVSQGRFRQDLYYRLNVLHLRVPSLRERAGDIVLLARHFLGEYVRRHDRRSLRASDGFFEGLLNHDWPGNVRELRSIIERAVVMARTDVLSAAELDLPQASAMAAEDGAGLPEKKRQAVASIERSYLCDLLREHGGNVTKAAAAAGTERRSLQRLMRKHGITRDQFRTPLPSAS